MSRERSFQSPKSLADARSLLERAEGAVLVAGGQWLVPFLKSGDVTAHHLISLQQVAELRRIDCDGETATIGAGETHEALARSSIITTKLPILVRIAGQIGDPATRHRGTLGGAFGSEPARSDYAGVWMGLNGEMKTTHRALSAEEFFSSQDHTPLHANEIIVSLKFQVPKWAAYQKIPHPAANHAEVGLFIGQLQNKSWRVIALSDKNGPMRLNSLEAQLEAGAKPAQLTWPEELVQTAPFFASRLRALMDRALEGAPNE